MHRYTLKRLSLHYNELTSNEKAMKKIIFRLIVIVITGIIHLNVNAQTNNKIDNLDREIRRLQERIENLKDSIHYEILENGYPLTIKQKYDFLPIKVKLKEYGNETDTLSNGEEIQILSKTTSFFKVRYRKNKIGYVYISDIDIPLESPLNFLKNSSSERVSRSFEESSTTNSSGDIYVKGYYRKNGTYVRPHTRSRSGKRK